MGSYAQIIVDRRSKIAEVISSASDDTKMTNNTAEMIRAGIDVFCTREDREYTKYDTSYGPYKFENGLYDRLFEEYHTLTGKSLKRW
jgi:hypothetical protein